MAKNISMSEVLLNLRDGQKCSLAYIRATGKRRGSMKHIINAIEGWNYRSFKSRTPIEHIRARFETNINKNKQKGIIPIIDLDNKQQLTLHISHLVKYNGLTIVH